MSLLSMYLLSGCFFFLSFLKYAIIADVILSWLTLLGIQVIIWPLNSITVPLYKLTKKIFPTQLGVLDLAPLVLLIILDIGVNILSPFILR